MVIGTRRGVHSDAGRNGHAFGNRILQHPLLPHDLRPGFHRYPPRLPGLFAPFRQKLPGRLWRFRDRDRNVRARITAQTAGRRTGNSITAGAQKARTRNSSTFKDGGKILWMFAMLMKKRVHFALLRPLISALLHAVEPWLPMAPVLVEYFETGACHPHADMGALDRAAACCRS